MAETQRRGRGRKSAVVQGGFEKGAEFQLGLERWVGRSGAGKYAISNSGRSQGQGEKIFRYSNEEIIFAQHLR